MNALGLDIGGTKIAGALVDPDGTILQRVFRPTPADDPEGIVEVCREIQVELGGPTEAFTAGVAAAAFIDRKREAIYFAPNISWRDFPLKARMENALGLPVRIENDANAAGWAEFRFGAAKDAHSMMMLTMGTGVGGALIDDGVLLLGGFGSAGELGHMVIEPGGLECGCGNRGCLEQYASGTALMREARDVLSQPELSSEELEELLTQGHPGAQVAFERVCDAMGRGIASLVSVTDPEIVVIGGGVARAGSMLSDLIQARFLAHYPAATHKPVASVVVATLGNSAGVVGAADLARQQYGSEA